MTEWSHHNWTLSTPKKPRRSHPKLPGKRPGPAGGTRDRNRRETQQRLLDAALVLFLAHGTEAVTIDEIVARARMAKGSFYRYARDKAAVVAMIMEPVEVEVIGALDRCARAIAAARREHLAAIYIQLATDLLKVVSANTSHVLLYLQEARAPTTDSRRTIHAIAAELTARAVALTQVALDHALIREVDPRVSGVTVLGAIDALLFEQLRGRRAASEAPRAITELVSIVLGGIRRDDGR